MELHEVGLGRRHDPDPRDRRFGATLVLPARIPPGTRYYPTGPILNQGLTGTCFPSGTYVQLESGAVQSIESVPLLGRVRTAEGRVGTVLGTSARMYEGPLVRLRLWGHSHLRLTPEHPVLTRRGYVAARDLQSQDWVALPLPQDRDTVSVVSTARWIGRARRVFQGAVEGPVNAGGVVTAVGVVPETIELTPAWGRLFGLYLAEGSVSPYKTVWTFGAHEEPLIRETVGLLSAVGATPRLQIRPNNAVNVVVHGHLWSTWFEAMFGVGAASKGLPAELLVGPSPFLSELLAGWVDGDGAHRRSTTTGVSVSRTLILNMLHIAQLLGKQPAVRSYQPKPSPGVQTRQRRWDLDWQDETRPSYRAERDDRAVWRRVRSTETELHVGPVFNLHVEGDESYIAEGVGVHNCVGHAGRQFLSSAPLMTKGGPSAMQCYRGACGFDPWSENDVEEYQFGTSVRALAKYFVSQGLITGSYLWMLTGDQVRDWILANLGGVIMGTVWTDEMMAVDNDGFLNVPDDSLLQRADAGHAYFLSGYSLVRDAFRQVNSWGTTWAQKGRCWIRRADLHRLIQIDGEACGATEQRITP